MKYQFNDTCINTVTLPIITSSFLDEDRLTLPDKLQYVGFPPLLSLIDDQF